MQIECTTTRAAAEVLLVLTDARMRLGREFHLAVPHSSDPLIRFTLRVNLPADVLCHVQGIPDIRIAGERGE